MKIRQCFFKLQLKMSGMFLRHSVEGELPVRQYRVTAIEFDPDYILYLK